MAQRLEEFPALSTRRYPWEQWLNGEVWQLFKGKGGSIRSRKLKDGGAESIIIQFVRR
jgi:hypothetical protein